MRLVTFWAAGGVGAKGVGCWACARPAVAHRHAEMSLACMALGYLLRGREHLPGCSVREPSQLQSQDLDLAFEARDTSLDGLARHLDRVRIFYQLADCGASQLRDAADTLRVAQLAELVVFFRGEAEADHLASCIKGP